jgi:AcrR family transcriptional regulator
MRCFWNRGFEQTSMRDLAGEMGITSASLYNAFGDKRSLYRRALDYYLEGRPWSRCRPGGRVTGHGGGRWTNDARDPEYRLVWIKTRSKVGESGLIGFAALLPAEAWAPPDSVC